MSSKELADRMSRAVGASGLAYPVSSSFGEDRVAVLCRVPKESEARWIDVITRVLVGASSSLKDAIRWQCHICKHYFLKETDGKDKIVWGWNFSVHAKEMSLALDSVIRIMKGQPIEEPAGDKVVSLRPHSKSGKLTHNIGGSADFHPGRK